MNRNPLNLGEVFGTFTVIGKETGEKNKTFYVIQCSCGNVLKRIGSRVKKGLSCTKCNIMKVIGTKKYKVTFLKYLYKSHFKCLCDCGNEFVGRLRSKSCGCHIEEEIIKDAKTLEGLGFGHFKILKFSHITVKNKSTTQRTCVYNAKCCCGKIFQVKRGHLKLIKTCGCRKLSKHAKGQYQGSAIHLDKQVKAAIDLYLTDQYSKQEICSMTGISMDTLKGIIINKSWKHIEADKKVLESSPLKSTFRKPKKRTIIKPNEQFGHWTVISKAPSRNTHAYWLCQCKCGRQCEVISSNLRDGGSKQCTDCALIHFTKRLYKMPKCI